MPISTQARRSVPFVFAAAALLVGCTQAEPVTYLIPDGYVGFVTVVFNQPGGQPVHLEDGRRVYEIPADGVLVSQFSGPNEGYTDEQYVYVQADGTRRAITERLDSTLHDTPDNRADGNAIVYRREMSGLNESGTMMERFVVGTKAQILGLDFFQEEQRVDRLLDARGVQIGTTFKPESVPAAP